MERRWVTRKAANVDVLIRQRSGNVLPGRIRDVSLGGLFVETDGGRLEADSDVALAFARAENGDRRIRSLRAVVARRTANGIGLRINDFSWQTLPALLTLLTDDTRPA